MKKKLVEKIVIFLLLSSTLVHSKNIKKLEINQKIDKNKIVSIKGYETEVLNSDLDNDGVEEKIILNWKEEGNTVEAFISIYINQNEEYKLKYQIPFEKNVHLFNINYAKRHFEKIVKYFREYSKNISDNEVRYIRINDANSRERVYFDLKYDKYSPKELDEFLFIGNTTILYENPSSKSNKIKTLKYKEKIKILSEIYINNGNDEIKWYLVEMKDGTRGFIKEESTNIKRGFLWDKMYSKMKELNEFIKKSKKENKELYIVREYKPMVEDIYSQKDKFGNRTNQSILGYENINKKGEIINIPDRTIFKILNEKNGMLEVESPYYGRYFIEKNNKNFEKWDINEEIKKIIVIDTHSQTEAIFEKEKNRYRAITYSFVTTGKDNGFSSYETPKGVFLVAFTRPYMAFGKKIKDELTLEEKVEITGKAKGAIRFSGGGYMHGIPVSEKTEDYIRTKIEDKIGTYKESHKCVRHYDDQIDFIMKWVNGNSKPQKGDKVIPEIPVVTIVI